MYNTIGGPSQSACSHGPTLSLFLLHCRSFCVLAESQIFDPVGNIEIISVNMSHYTVIWGNHCLVTALNPQRCSWDCQVGQVGPEVYPVILWCGISIGNFHSLCPVSGCNWHQARDLIQMPVVVAQCDGIVIGPGRAGWNDCTRGHFLSSRSDLTLARWNKECNKTHQTRNRKIDVGCFELTLRWLFTAGLTQVIFIVTNDYGKQQWRAEMTLNFASVWW